MRNPGRGWYSTYPLFPRNPPDMEYLETTLHEDQVLCLVEIGLEHYRQEPVDEKGLKHIRSFLEFFARRKKRMILRPTYDLEGKAYEKEPLSLELICEHMRQVLPVFLEFAPHIYVVQGLFVGAWGEMHSSRYVDGASLQGLYGVWKDLVGDRLALAVRTPALAELVQASGRAGLAEPLQPHRASLGLFDDALLYDHTDMGTFPEGRAKAWKAWKPMIASVPFGGEVLLGREDHLAQKILGTLRRMELSYLNIQYDERMLRRWREMTYQGQTLFHYIDCHMGYRFCVRRIDWKESGEELLVVLTIENTGFAPCYEALYVEVVPLETVCFASEEAGGKPVEPVRVPVGAGAWKPGRTGKLLLHLPIGFRQGVQIALYSKQDGSRVYFANAEFASTLILPMKQP